MGQQKARNAVVILFAVASFTVVIAGVSAALVRAGVESGAVGIGFGLMLSNRTEKLVASPRSRYDRIFVLPGANTAPEHLIAIYSFAFQIYFDFSGYTDMARGLARLLGLELPLNFCEPYLSRNPAEFWQRGISLCLSGFATISISRLGEIEQAPLEPSATCS